MFTLYPRPPGVARRPRTKRYAFETTCVHSTGEWIDDMTEAATEVTYRTVLKHCRGLLQWAESVGYDVRGDGLRLWKDWHVTFHKSVYRGMPCYYVQWSGIEHIWTLRETEQETAA